MNLRPFGRTGLDVSEIGFGCGPTAKLMVGDDHALRLRAIAHALEHGVTYFDTAAAYGAGRSETNLGAALRELGATATIATKVTLEAGDFEDIPAAVTRSVEASLRRLQVERVAIVHLHNRFGAARAVRSPFGSGAQLVSDDAQAAADALAALQERGLIGAFGCCAFGGEPDAVSAVVASGRYQSIIVNYSLLNPSALSAAPMRAGRLDYKQTGAHAAARGMGVAALRVLEGGALAHPPSGDTAALSFLSEADDATLVQPAIRFALSDTRVSTVIVGFSDIAQIDDAVAAAACGPFSAETCARIDAARVA